MPGKIRAFSFQSDVTFEQAKQILGVPEGPNAEVRTPYGKWFERDSAWWDRLLSCRSHPGASLNLYFLDGETILEIKFGVSDSEQQERLSTIALNEILPALRARDVKPTSSPN